MAKLLSNKDNLFKFGYCVIRNLLNDEEIQKYRLIIKKIHEKTGEECNFISEHRESWEFIFNDRILNAMRSVLGPNISYLHDSSFSHLFYNKKNDFSKFANWHRDNPCRRFGKGADWDKNEPYNVVTAIIYLSSNEGSNSSVNVIPFSHKKKFTLSNMLRILHHRIKKITFLLSIRKLFQSFLGVNIQTNPGDCVIFLSNVLHKALPHPSLRQWIVFHYGIGNKHSKNYINYILKHRTDFRYNIDNNDQSKLDDFFKFLKDKNIFYPIPEKKENIEGALVSKADY